MWSTRIGPKPGNSKPSISIMLVATFRQRLQLWFFKQSNFFGRIQLCNSLPEWFFKHFLTPKVQTFGGFLKCFNASIFADFNGWNFQWLEQNFNQLIFFAYFCQAQWLE